MERELSVVTLEPSPTPAYEPPAPTGVLIADDHPLVIAGLRRTLDNVADIEVVGEAGSGPELQSMIDRRAPDVVLMDLRMPGVVGDDCIAQIHARWPAVKIVVLSACEDQPSIDGALQAGASAYVLKSAQALDVASIIRQAATGVAFHAPVPPTPEIDVGQAERPRLTTRELTILGAVSGGSTTTEISHDLWVSEHTIKFHLTNIYRKIGVHNRAGAVRYALEHDLAA